MTAADAAPIERAFRWACALDVQVRKPGNVSFASAGHRMVAQQFIDSAAAAAPALAAAGAAVGARIERAVAASLAAAGCNTNLGIVLLCAPLAAAAEAAGSRHDAAALRAAVGAVLARLDVDDARAAYRAIAAAGPGGLGHAAAQDVGQAPTVDLRRAMTLAADRDSIARQYANGFADLFGLGLQTWRAESAPEPALFAAWLAYLAHWPDTHIVRKLGPAPAQTVTATAAQWHARWQARLRHRDAPGPDPQAVDAWDRTLKSAGINPGTSADLAVATAFVAALLEPRLTAAIDLPGGPCAG